MKKEDEYISQLNRIWSENRKHPGFQYFTDVMFDWYLDFFEHRRTYPVVVLGSGIPLEPVMSLGVRPLFLLGGSHETCRWSEELVPRDTDPVSRSILGYLHNPGSPDFTDTLFIVPLVCDSMRKIAYLLKEEGRKVFPLDIPPVHSNDFSIQKWHRQADLLAEALEDHLCRGIKEKELRRNVRLITRARGCLYEFLKMASEHEDCISGSARMLVQNSFYCAKDLESWTQSLKQLTKEILGFPGKRTAGFGSSGFNQSSFGTSGFSPAAFSQSAFSTSGFSPAASDMRPRILLMGSPVFFPGYKIPFLLEETGLCIWRNLDASTVPFQMPPGISGARGLRKLLRSGAASWYYADASSAYIVNDSMRSLTATLAESSVIDGVVFHVLKGQVEPDFELGYYEEFFAERGIPSFRLETDYQYQDIEQLRIRMEAFREMLVHNRLKKEKAV
ncbi:MAG: 2-hydroxyacyl-CoA dehydratase family protein [Eubacteriales bacterium]|nr:2-hydroxyacyl-CoA dehydratase family protein [Eubacteriales bacterium]